MQSLHKLLAKESMVEIRLVPEEREEIESQYQLRKDLINERIKINNPDENAPTISLTYDLSALAELAKNRELFKDLPVIGVANENLFAIISAKSENQNLIASYNKALASEHTAQLIRDLHAIGTSAYSVINKESLINSINPDAIPLVSKENNIAIDNTQSSSLYVEDEALNALLQMPLVKARLVSLNNYVITKMNKETENYGAIKSVFPATLVDLNDEHFNNLIKLTIELNRAFFDQLERIYEDCCKYAKGAEYTQLKQLLDDIVIQYTALCKEIEAKYEAKESGISDKKLILIAEENISTDPREGHLVLLRNVVDRSRYALDDVLKAVGIDTNIIKKISNKLDSQNNDSLSELFNSVYKDGTDVNISTYEYNNLENIIIFNLKIGEKSSSYLIDLSSIDYPIIKPYSGSYSENNLIGEAPFCTQTLEEFLGRLTNHRRVVGRTAITLDKIQSHINDDIETLNQCQKDIKNYTKSDGNTINIIQTIEKLCEVHKHFHLQNTLFGTSTMPEIPTLPQINNSDDDGITISAIYRKVIDWVNYNINDGVDCPNYGDKDREINPSNSTKIISQMEQIYSTLDKWRLDGDWKLVELNRIFDKSTADYFKYDSDAGQRVIVAQYAAKIFYCVFQQFIDVIRSRCAYETDYYEIIYRNKVLAKIILSKALEVLTQKQ